MNSDEFLKERRQSERFINNIVNEIIHKLEVFTLEGFYRLINSNISGVAAYPSNGMIEVVVNSYGFQMYKTYFVDEIEKQMQNELDRRVNAEIERRENEAGNKENNN
jgi:histidinol phosphatase-like enzyme